MPKVGAAHWYAGPPLQILYLFFPSVIARHDLTTNSLFNDVKGF